MDYAWSGNFLLTLNRLPQFGRLNGNVYFAQGYSGHGVTCSHLAGKLIAETMRGESERFDAFAGLPHLPFPGVACCGFPSQPWALGTTPPATGWVSELCRSPRSLAARGMSHLAGRQAGPVP